MGRSFIKSRIHLKFNTLYIFWYIIYSLYIFIYVHKFSNVFVLKFTILNNLTHNLNSSYYFCHNPYKIILITRNKTPLRFLIWRQVIGIILYFFSLTDFSEITLSVPEGCQTTRISPFCIGVSMSLS